MAIRKTLGFAVVIGVLMPSLGVDLRAAPPMSVGELTARQSIKNQIVDALADGYISPAESEDIFAGARETLRPQEMAGLQRTMDRLTAQTNSRRTEVVASMPPQGFGRYPSPQGSVRYPSPQGFGKYLHQYAGWEPRISRPYHPMPYYRPQREPDLFAGGIAGSLRRLPYIERPELNGNWARQVARDLPRLNEFAPGRPTGLASQSHGGYIVRTMPASAPQAHQTAARPYRISASNSSRSPTRIQKVAAAKIMPEVEAPVAMAPLPDDEVSRPEDLSAVRAPRHSGPDYRTSRTAYLESLRSR
jgi:hypothetical protein